MLSNKRPDSMERITTKEPDEEIIEVAIRSIIEVIPEDTNGELA